jgi:hypothetical protein
MLSTCVDFLISLGRLQSNKQNLGTCFAIAPFISYHSALLLPVSIHDVKVRQCGQLHRFDCLGKSVLSATFVAVDKVVHRLTPARRHRITTSFPIENKGYEELFIAQQFSLLTPPFWIMLPLQLFERVLVSVSLSLLGSPSVLSCFTQHKSTTDVSG